MIKKIIKNRIFRKVISFILVFAVIFNITSFDNFLVSIIVNEKPGTEKKSFAMVVHAEDDPPDDTPSYANNYPASNFSGNHNIMFANNPEEFYAYCYWYRNDSSFAAFHQNDTLDINYANFSGVDMSRHTLPETFVGLGTSDYPFGGSIKISASGSYKYFEFFNSGEAFFNYVYNTVTITNNLDSNLQFKFQRSEGVDDGKSHPLFANHVINNPASVAPAEWDVELMKINYNTYSGVIGEIHDNATVNLTFANNSGSDIVSNADGSGDFVADVGGACGKIDSGAKLNLTYTETKHNYSITSAQGNAGGLVGTMEGNATLNIKDMPSDTNRSVISTTGYAGGLVGHISSDATVTVEKVNGTAQTKLEAKGTISGKLAAGGLYGYYENKKTSESIDLNNYNAIDVTVSGDHCGGLFGEFKNTNSSVQTVTFTNTGIPTFTVNGGGGKFGGLIGKYSTNDLKDILNFTSMTYSVNANSAFTAFGGAIGKIESAAYINVNDLTITASGTDKGTAFGGVVGETADENTGDFIDLDNFTLTVSDTAGFNGGGIVGHFNSGVLRLSGTTDLSSAKTNGGENCGQLVGYNNNVLVYATGNGSDANWTFKRSSTASKADDLGTWGEVVRIGSIETNILTVDTTTNHTVILKGVTANNNSIYEIGDQTSFVKTALNIMLNQGTDYDCLKFTAGSGTRTTLLAASLKLTTAANLSLSGTGVNGLMRDGAVGISESDVDDGITSVGTFTGTFDGNDKTITLTTGETYGKRGNSAATGEGSGQIYRHQYNGLFAVVGNGTTAATVKKLTIAGTIDIRNQLQGGMNVGGVAARSHGSTTLNKITAKQTVNFYDSTDAGSDAGWGRHIGGLIGFADNNSDNGTISITGATVLDPTFNFSGNLKKYLGCGGAIGSVLSSKIIVNFASTDVTDTCTVTMTTSVASGTSGDDYSVGIAGLIGYIHTNGVYSDKTVNIKNTSIGTEGEGAKACTIVNPSTSSVGGIMGYSWCNTTANVNGLTIKNCAITCTSANDVGIMAYSATGVWNVNDLTVKKVTSTGASTSLGILVNKAYVDNNALYLNVLNSGYTFPTSANVSIAASGVYDELAAYSAPDQTALLSGGNGVAIVSVNMNPLRTGTLVKVTDTGTYQNKLSSYSTKFANPNTRYYYNLDKMSSSDDAQNLLLWSVNKYAASNISDIFSSTLSTTLSGDCDMSGLSFYPVKNSGGCTIGNLTLTLDYDGLYTNENAASYTNNSTFSSDSYNRDPGATGTAKNQHYLMHSGLFMNMEIDTSGTTPSMKTLTVSGALRFAGNFLSIPASDAANAAANAANGYCGVLYSRTMTGKLTVGSGGSIIFDGLYTKTTGNTVYTDGYLLVNNVVRATDQAYAIPAFDISITLSNVSTTDKYTALTAVTLPVASSMFGRTTGKDLSITLSKMKLDARTADLSDSTANTNMNTAYGTTRSIFKNATFFESIKTNQDAQLIYDYTWAEDWGGTAARNVTYGKEVYGGSGGSKEYLNKENKYSGEKRWFTNPVDNSERATQYNFSSGFLKYVHVDYEYDPDENDMYYRELKVNVVATGLTTGCGTYNDPYIITVGDQLEAVAKFLQTGKPQDLGDVCLPKAKESFDTLADNTSGSRWCTDKTGNAYHAVYDRKDDNTFKFKASEVEANNWSKENVQYYLANAYYMIDDSSRDIELTEQFVGLGGKTANTAFRGVIVGKKNPNGGSPRNPIIYNKSLYSFINVSNGSVVKDVDIVVAKDTIRINQNTKGTAITATNNDNAAFGYDSACKYYGGIIGEIMGGDNIIDNSYVDYNFTEEINSETVNKNTTIKLNGTDTSGGTIVPVGGYVGVIVYGGLIFKNMTRTDSGDLVVNNSHLTVKYQNETDNLAAYNTTAGKAAIYVNPIVGRVINGYAVNETRDIPDPEHEGQYLARGKYSISEDGYYHDDGVTKRLDLPTPAQLATINSTPYASLSAELKKLKDNYDKLHTLKNSKKHYTIADINKSDTQKLDVSTVAASGTIGEINIPNSQSMFILSLITQSCAGTAAVNSQTSGNTTTYKDGNYSTSLAYGTNTTVYGINHVADYSDVGTSTADKLTVDDFIKYATYDTADNSSVPYIIMHYTNGTFEEEEKEAEYPLFSGTKPTDLDGKTLYISNTRGGNTKYLLCEKYEGVPIDYHGGRTSVLKAVDFPDATPIIFNKIANEDYYTLSFTDANDVTKYLKISLVASNTDRGNIEIVDSITDGCYFSVTYNDSTKKWNFSVDKTKNNLSKTQYVSRATKGNSPNIYYFYNAYKDADDGSPLDLHEITLIPPSKTYVYHYPARCVTTTAGYYNVNLTGKTANGTTGANDVPIPLTDYTYQLPDSFRGLGCVGIYDSVTGIANKYSMKVNKFDGKGCTVDEDIYINKFEYDNYFDTLHKGANQTLSDAANNGTAFNGNTNTAYHGIGMFDSYIAKTAESYISDFTLTGSVNTEIYDNEYKISGQEKNYVNPNKDQQRSLWLSSGGVCGWITNGTTGGFEKIVLDKLKVSGADFVGGLLGYSGLGEQKPMQYVTIKQCSARDISVEMTSARNIEDIEKSRNGMGCFVGKVQEGAVYIYGTEDEDSNTDTDKFSSVVIKSFGFAAPTLNYYVCTGGLVGFAGNGCKVYDMKVMPSEGRTVTIGNNNVRFAGGLVGAMQSQAKGGTTGIAYFRNCTVQEINVNGNYAGGFYGGKWDSEWTTYSITLDNCNMVGSSSAHNTIFGNDLFGDKVSNTIDHAGYVGGFIGRLYPYTNLDDDDNVTHNVLIKDCTVSNYDITGSDTATSYAGGFIGYASAAQQSVTCYMHDSSIENCTIGASGNYAGGIIGRIIQKPNNQILGYNIKLDTILSSSGDNMGTWIGHAPDDNASNKTEIQVNGVAIYGNGFGKNIGNNANLGTASFVFADYTERGEYPVSDTTAQPVITIPAENEAAGVTVTDTCVENPSPAKTITRTIVTTTVTRPEIGNPTKKSVTRTVVYPYGKKETTTQTGQTVTEDSNTWDVDDTTGAIIHVVGSQSEGTITTTTYTIPVSQYNDTANVTTMPRYPFVNVNPYSKTGSSKIISGDGAVLCGSSVTGYSGKSADKTMAAKIYSELSDTSNTRRYTTFGAFNLTPNAVIDENNNKIDAYLNRTVDDDGDRISTYFAETGLTAETAVTELQDVDNFAVVVIANLEHDETTNLINRYIQLVTNTTADYTLASDYYDIVVSNCTYNTTTHDFETDKSHAGLDWTAPAGNTPGQFELNGTYADSEKTGYTFTLVDVQFKDPFNINDIAYHLYVPVYTVKQITYKFQTTMLTGTDSVQYNSDGTVSSSDYAETLGTIPLHIDSMETWITQYIRFSYKKEDIDGLLSSGELDWNFDKKMLYTDITGSAGHIPDGSYMILVDPNANADTAWYTTVATTGASPAFNYNSGVLTVNFSSFTNAAGDNFTPGNFGDILAGKLTRTDNPGHGKYNKLTTTEQAPVPASYDLRYLNNGVMEYYEFVSEGNGNYDFTLTAQNFEEDYYLSFYIPIPVGYNNELYFYQVSGSPTLTNTLKQKTAKRESASHSMNVLIADLYEQKTEEFVVKSSNENDPVMSSTNNTLHVRTASTIRLKNTGASSFIVSATLKHAFNLVLSRYYGDGSVKSDIVGCSGVTAKYAYTTNGYVANTPTNVSSSAAIDPVNNSFIRVPTVNNLLNLINQPDNTSHSVTIYADVTIPFYPTSISDEFPQRINEQQNVGVNVTASSNLAYSEDRLDYTSITEAFAPNSQYYYIESVNLAMLNYYAETKKDEHDYDGAKSNNMSLLGVNGRPMTSKYELMPISTKADYNVGILDNYEDGDKIRLTLTLNKKVNITDQSDPPTVIRSEYNEVPIYTYFGNSPDISVKCGNITFTKVTEKCTANKLVYEANGQGSSEASKCTVDEAGFYHFDILFYVKTLGNFKEYSNYQVNLQAELYASAQSKRVDNSFAKDYVVYTNAKVNNSVIQLGPPS